MLLNRSQLEPGLGTFEFACFHRPLDSNFDDETPLPFVILRFTLDESFVHPFVVKNVEKLRFGHGRVRAVSKRVCEYQLLSLGRFFGTKFRKQTKSASTMR